MLNVTQIAFKSKAILAGCYLFLCLFNFSFNDSSSCGLKTERRRERERESENKQNQNNSQLTNTFEIRMSNLIKFDVIASIPGIALIKLRVIKQ